MFEGYGVNTTKEDGQITKSEADQHPQIHFFSENSDAERISSALSQARALCVGAR